MENRPITKMDVFERICGEDKIDLGKVLDFGIYRDMDSGEIIRLLKCKEAPFIGTVNVCNTGRRDNHGNPVYEIQNCDPIGVEDSGEFTHLIDFSDHTNLMIHRVGSPSGKPLAQPGEGVIKFNLTIPGIGTVFKLGGERLTTIAPSIRTGTSNNGVVGLNLEDSNNTYLLQYRPDRVVCVVMISAIRSNYYMDNITHNIERVGRRTIIREGCGEDPDKIFVSGHILYQYEQLIQPLPKKVTVYGSVL